MARTGARALVLAASLAATLTLNGCGAAPPRAQIPACTGAASIDFECYEKRYRAMSLRLGATAAVRDLSERTTRVGYLRSACHQLMHRIGRATGARHGIRGFAAGDDSCSSGYYHGVVEAVMERAGPRRAAGACAPFRKRSRHGEAHYNCVHGMGHGYMGLHDSDVFRSLRSCSDLRDPWEERHCIGGVFMENLTAMTNPERPSRALRPEQPLYPCTAVERRYKHECYMKHTAYVLFLRDDDFGAAFDICANSPDVSFRDDCYQGLGGDAAIHSSKYITGAAAKRATTRALCRLGPSLAARRECVTGAVTVTVRDGASRTTDAVAFCDGLRAQPALRAACARAHLATVRDVATGVSWEASTKDVDGKSPSFLCERADALEEASRRAWETHPDRRTVQ